MKALRDQYILFILLFLVGSSALLAQSNVAVKNLTNGTIKEQFDYITFNSKNLEESKVIKLSWLEKIESNLSDSINDLKKKIKESNLIVDTQKEDITNLQQDLSTAVQNLNNSKAAKDQISLFGIQMKKFSFKLIMWTIVVLLGLLLIFFVMQFANSKVITAQSKKNYAEVSNEFETYKQKSMENELILRRKLQDEINKRL